MDIPGVTETRKLSCAGMTCAPWLPSPELDGPNNKDFGRPEPCMPHSLVCASNVEAIVVMSDIVVCPHNLVPAQGLIYGYEL